MKNGEGSPLVNDSSARLPNYPVLDKERRANGEASPLYGRWYVAHAILARERGKFANAGRLALGSRRVGAQIALLGT